MPIKEQNELKSEKKKAKIDAEPYLNVSYQSLLDHSSFISYTAYFRKQGILKG